jgi:chromosome partitioning protein
MRSIAVVNQKGGQAKTATALCLAVGMAGKGLRTLLVDADAQGNATMTMLDGGAAEPPTLGNVLVRQSSIADAARPTRLANLDLLPADARLADAALLLAEVPIGREHRLRDAMAGLESRYDAAIVDCPPSMSLVVVNVLVAVGEIVVPISAGIYSVAGLAQLQSTVEDVRRYLGNRTLHISGLVMTQVHNNRASKDIEAQLREAYGTLVYRSTIPHSVRVEEAHARNLTVTEFAPTSAPAKAYGQLLEEVLSHGDEQSGRADSTLDPDPAERLDDAEAAA